MRKCIKKLTSYILTIVVSFGMAIGFAGCGKKADSFTEEEHIQRITARLEKRVESYDDEKKEKYADGGTDNGRRKHDVVYATDNLRD